MGCITIKDSKSILSKSNTTLKKEIKVPNILIQTENKTNHIVGNLNKLNDCGDLITHDNKDKDIAVRRRLSLFNGKIIKSNVNINQVFLDKHILVNKNYSDPYETYITIKCIGEGSFGKVFQVKNKFTGEIRAMKVINKSFNLISEEEKEILNEVEKLTKLDHPNIIKLYEYYITSRKIFFIMEICTGGELFDKILEINYFNEGVAAHIMKQIFSVLSHCHERHIFHKDLKPENILIETQEEKDKEFFNIKVIDFGTNETLKHNITLKEKTASSYYMSPELILFKERQYNNKMNDSQVTEKTDIWSCGVILFILLCGSPPFNSESDEGVFKKIKEGVFNFKSDIWKRISNEAQSLIKQLLQLDYNKRPNAKEVLNHEWFIKNTLENNKKIKELNKELTSNNKYMKKIVFNIKTFRSVKKLQQAALAFIVHNLASREEIQELRNIFYSFDENGDGKLTKEELINGMKEVMTKGEALQNVEAIMSRIDIDKNGYIEYEEFLNAALNRERLLSRDNIKLAFDLFDTDGSGFISKDELKTILGKGRNIDLNDDIWSMLINEIDDNTDGVISFDEFYEMMNKMIDKNV